MTVPTKRIDPKGRVYYHWLENKERNDEMADEYMKLYVGKQQIDGLVKKNDISKTMFWRIIDRYPVINDGDEEAEA